MQPTHPASELTTRNVLSCPVLCARWLATICGTLLESESGIVSVCRKDKVDCGTSDGDASAYASEPSKATSGTRRGKVGRGE